MKQEVEIILSELFNNSLNTRESVYTLIHRIREEIQGLEDVHVVLDFNEIDFMSRSFADEFHKAINHQNFDVGFTFKNMKCDLLAMLKAVENTQNNRASKFKRPTVLSFKDFNTLEDYAFSW